MVSTDDRGPEVRAVAATMFGIAAAALLLRCYVRLRIVRAFGLDDFFMVFAMTSFTFNSATCLISVYYGAGQHMATLTPINVSAAMMYWWYCYLSFAMSMMLSKTSIACFLLRITPGRIHRCIILTALGFTLACGVAFFFIVLLQCSPVSFFWTRTGNGQCRSVDGIITIGYIYSVIAIITDLALTLLPIWLVCNLQMDRRIKIYLIPILSMTCIASCAVAVRMSHLQDFRKIDFLYDTTDIVIWTQIEQGLAITAGSLATLQPLFRAGGSRFGLTAKASTAPTARRGDVTHYEDRFTEHSSYNRYSRRQSSHTGQIPHSLSSLSSLTDMNSAEERERSLRTLIHDASERDRERRIRDSGLHDSIQYHTSIKANANVSHLDNESQERLHGISQD